MVVLNVHSERVKESLRNPKNKVSPRGWQLQTKASSVPLAPHPSSLLVVDIFANLTTPLWNQTKKIKLHYRESHKIFLCTLNPNKEVSQNLSNVQSTDGERALLGLTSLYKFSCFDYILPLIYPVIWHNSFAFGNLSDQKRKFYQETETNRRPGSHGKSVWKFTSTPNSSSRPNPLKVTFEGALQWWSKLSMYKMTKKYLSCS